MARISFTDNLHKHVPCPPTNADGDTVRDVLETVFADNPGLRSYLLDDQGRMRKHVNIYIGGAMIEDRIGLTDAIAPNDEIYVFQALSGG